MNDEELDIAFQYHMPTIDAADRILAIRDLARRFAGRIMELCPDRHERELAIDRLREAMLWATTSIACGSAKEAIAREQEIIRASGLHPEE